MCCVWFCLSVPQLCLLPQLTFWNLVEIPDLEIPEFFSNVKEAGWWVHLESGSRLGWTMALGTALEQGQKLERNRNNPGTGPVWRDELRKERAWMRGRNRTNGWREIGCIVRNRGGEMLKYQRKGSRDECRREVGLRINWEDWDW